MKLIKMQKQGAAIMVALVSMIGTSAGYGAHIRIDDKYIYSGPNVSQNAAGYLSLTNNESTVITLITVDSDAATRAEIHGHAIKDGAMSMFKVTEGLTLEPGKTMKLQPGGYHVMFMGLKKPLTPGDKVDLTLHFSDGDAIDVQLPVGDQPEPGIQLHKASARTTAPGMNSSAAYMTIDNNSNKTVQLMSLNSPIAKRTELHTTTMKDGVMKMQQVKDLAIKAGEQVELKPGGYHIMLMGLSGQIKPGDQVPVTMTFSDGQTVTVNAKAMNEIKGQGMAH